MKKFLVFTIVILGVFGIVFNVKAYSEYFDTYLNGSQINGQGGWHDTQGSTTVTNIEYSSSPNSLKTYAPGGSLDWNRISTNATSSIFTLRFYQAAGTESIRWTLGLESTTTPTGSWAHTYCYLDKYSDNTLSIASYDGGVVGYYLSNNVSTSTWHEVKIKIDLTNNTCAGQYDGNNWSTTTDLTTNEKNGYLIKFENVGINKTVYFDNLSLADLSGNVIPGLSQGWSLSSLYPLLCQQNTVTDFTGTAQGTISIDSILLESLPHFHLNKLELQAQDINTYDTYIASTTFVSIGPGQSYDFSIPFSLPSGTTYKMVYVADGLFYPGLYQLPYEIRLYPGWGANNMGNLNPLCETTYGDYTSSTAIYVPFPEYEYSAENCEGMSTTERLLCDIKNWLEGLFLVSPSTTEKVINTVNLTAKRAPYNYIIVFQTFLSNIYSPTSTATTYADVLEVADNVGEWEFVVFVRNLIAGVLYILFGLLLLKIIRHMFK